MTSISPPSAVLIPVVDLSRNQLFFQVWWCSTSSALLPTCSPVKSFLVFVESVSPEPNYEGGDNERRDLFCREPLTFSGLQPDVHDGKSVAASETNYRETIDHAGEEPHWLRGAWTSLHKSVCTSELDQTQTWKITFSVNVLVHETTILCGIYPDLFKQLE